MFLRRLRHVPGVVVSALLMVAPVPAPAQQTPAAPPLVRIATSPAETYAQAFYAQALGLYAKAGLNVEVTALATGAAVSTAVVGGAADVGVSTTLNIANAITRGVPLVIIAPSGMTTRTAPTGLLCAAKNAPYKTAKDFDGATIAIPALKQTADLAVRVWLTQGGMDPARVHIIEAPFPEMAPSVERGTYAAAAISEPSLNRAITSGGVRCFADPYGAIAPQYMFAAWFVTKAFADKYPDAVRKIGAALTEAGIWANSHHFASAEVVSRVNRVDVDTIRAEVRPVYAEAINISEIQPQLDAGYKFGFLTRPVNAAELLGNK